MIRTIFALLLATSIAGAASSSAAQQMPALPTGVRIVLASCERIVHRAPLLEQARIELLSTGVVDIEVIDPDTGSGGRVGDNADRIATLQVYYPECDEEGGLVNLRISDRLTAKYVERSLVVSDVRPEARPRAIALAIVELLRASWLELVITQREDAQDDAASSTVRSRLVTRLKEATEDDDEDDDDRKRADAPSSRSHVPSDEALDERWEKPRLEWLGGSRLFPQGGSGDLSTAVKLSRALNRRLRLHVGGIAAGGGVNATSDVHMFEAAGLAGMGITGGLEPEVEIASVFEVGYGRITGQDVKDVERVLAIGTLQGAVRAQITAGVDAIVGVQAGYVLSPAVVKTAGSDKVIGGWSGPVIGIIVGLAGIL